MFNKCDFSERNKISHTKKSYCNFGNLPKSTKSELVFSHNFSQPYFYRKWPRSAMAKIRGANYPHVNTQ